MTRSSAAGSMSESVPPRSEEHTSELQSRQYLVCRLLLEKKNEYEQYDSLVQIGYPPATLTFALNNGPPTAASPLLDIYPLFCQLFNTFYSSRACTTTPSL